MGKLTYPLFLWKNHRSFVLFSGIFVGVFQLLVISLITAMDSSSFLVSILEQMPEKFQALVNEELISRFSVLGAAALGFNHPLIIILMAINAITIPARHITGEIEAGTMELLLAHPFRRITLLLSLWATSCLTLLLIVFAGWLGSLTTQAVKYGMTHGIVSRVMQIGANLWLLFVLVMSYSMLISVFGKEGSRSGIWAGIVTLLFYFFHYISTIWDYIGFIKPFNIFTYYQPQKLMFDQGHFTFNVGVLGMLIMICLVASVFQFKRRDIP